MSRLRQDAVYALRTFARTPGFTAVAVLVLAVGIGANTAIFTIVNELLLRPLSGRTGELVGVYARNRTIPDSYRPVSYPDYLDIRARQDMFDAVMAHALTMVGTPAGDGTKPSLAAVVSSNYFETLGVALAAGRPFTADEERPGSHVAVAIVPYARWAAAGRTPAFIGSTIRLNAEDVTVVGVTPEGFTGTLALISPDVYLPLGMFDAVVNDRFKNNGRGLADRSNAGLIVSGRLKTGLTEAGLSPRLDALSRQLETADPVANKDLALSVSPRPRLSAGPAPQTNAPLAALTALLLTLSGIVLVIACLNIANMLLARGSARRKELALRLALGAHRGRLIRQLLTESLLLAVAGAALGLVVSYWSTASLAASLTAVLPFSLTLRADPDAAVLVATAAFTGLSTIVFGLGPALKLSRRDLIADLKDRQGEARSSGGRFSARNLMVVGQVALSLGLLTAGGVFARSVVEAARATPGYSYDRLLVASVDTQLAGLDDPRGRATYASVLTALRSMSGVESATLASTMPFSGSIDGERLEAVGVSGREPVRARAYRTIGAGYFTTLGLTMLAGREFTSLEERSPDAPRVAIVDEAFARLMFGGENPIGRQIRVAPPAGQAALPEPPMEIVGIAPPLKEELLDRAPVPHVYVPFGSSFRPGMHAVVRLLPGADERAALDGVRREIHAAAPQMPVLLLSTLQAFQRSNVDLWGLKAGAWVFAGLAGLGLLLSALGVYGLRAYIVSQRTREIGIRFALGASPRDVLGQLLREGLVLVAAGVALGVPLAALVSASFASVFVDIGGFDALVIAVATVTLLLAAVAATIIPARRAAKVQPLTALRME